MPSGTVTSASTLVVPTTVPATLEESFGADAPENSEIRKIAQDVLDAAQYALTAVAAHPEFQPAPDSLEAAFKEGLTKLDAPRRAGIQQRAREIVEASEGVRTSMFGRYGKFAGKDLLGFGFAGAQIAAGPLALDQKLLGLRTPTITVPIAALKPTGQGLLLPSASLPSEFEGLKSLETLTSDFEDARAAAASSGVQDSGRLAELWGLGSPAPSTLALGVNGGDEFEAVVTDKLGFYISQVKCVDETNPEFWGSDEIAIGGVTVDETGDTHKIGETYVGGGFDDGDIKNYSPPWKFTWFNLQEAHGLPGSKWPKMYLVTLLLAEKDHGGFSSALDKVWQKVAAKVKEQVAKAVTEALAGLVGNEIAAAIGKAVAWVVDKLVGWIIAVFKDDIFPPYVAKLKVWVPNASWPGGSKTGPLQTAYFSGHGGMYSVKYYWKLYA